jgi:hypothetical protein
MLRPDYFVMSLMRRIRSACCPRAASGHPTAAPPSSVMNWRRFMFDMGLSHPVQPVSRTLSLARRDRLVLGADLKRSESSPAAGPTPGYDD